MAAWKLGEAVMTGNTIVLKPSPYTPLTTLLLGECFQNAFPAGVVNLVSGNDALGRAITEHPDIAKISFTGSTRTGKAIQAATAGTLKRLTLELGGNDAAIVLHDASVKETAQQIFKEAMKNTGQVCIAIKRCFVPDKLHDDFVRELSECARNAKVGDGFQEGVQYGPINNKMQFDRVKELVEDARRSGATIEAGGAPLPGDGYFYPPTIISGVKEGFRIVDEEQFGPVLPVIKYSDESDVVERANGTLFGLGGSVWGPVDRAVKVAETLDSGSVWINSHNVLTPDVPFGGRKESGVGRQMGQGTIEGYTDTKVIRIPKITTSKL
jgi:acyl-CoA reductase-like NAD-dependent aldehyde dehydrogenase